MRPITHVNARPRPESRKHRPHSPLLHTGRGWAALLLLAIVAWAGVASAQLPIPASTQFDMTGFLQEATLDGAGTGALQGGHLKVNGHIVTVPANTIVIYPANALTWQELFAKAPAPWGLATGAYNGGVVGPTTGMAMADCAIAPALTGCTAPPLTTYEVHVVGNRVPGAAGGDQYIAGLVDISQQGLNSGAGFINFINYTLGEMRVGGPIGVETGARVRLNDPVGRYGLATTSPDVRFTVDPDNPTIMSGTGYPMCLPRSAPAGGVTADVQCPEENRPAGLATVRTANLTSTCGGACVPSPAGTFPDSTLQAPFEVGDYITYAGTLVKDPPAGGVFAAHDGPTVGPMPAGGAAATYVSAHTITNNIAIYTFPGSNPAYVMSDVTLIGTGGLTVLGAGEAAIRTRFEGMTTDASRPIHLYGIDLTTAGVSSDRDWGTIGVDPGPAGGAGAVEGRWRFRPPCLPFGSVPAKPDKQCVMNAAGTFLPPTREMRAVIEGLQTQVAALNAGNLAQTAANGIFWGQYHAPITEYIFPENIPGTPIVENNFNALQFLACGGYSSSGIGIPPTTPVLAPARLDPWPSNVIPDPSLCPGFVLAPTASLTASPVTVFSGLTPATVVTLDASLSSGPAPLTFTFAQVVAAGDPVVTLTVDSLNPAKATFATPAVAASTTLNFTVTVTNGAASSVAAAAVAVVVDQPIVNHVPAQTLTQVSPAGVVAVMNITGVDPGGLPLTFTVTQTGGPVPNIAPLTVTQLPPSGATATFQDALAAGAPPVVFSFTIVATNSAGKQSLPEFTTVTIQNPVDIVTITSAEYRIGKQRLILNATSTATSTQNDLFLNPYACFAPGTPCKQDAVTGVWMYNPDPAAGGVGNLFTLSGGLYLIDLVGAPRPACGATFATPCTATPLRVRSSLGGLSAPSALTRIRQ
jgi:hypothetical protein